MAENTFGEPTELPAIPAVQEHNLTDIAQRVKEILEVWRGGRGDGLDRVVTVRDLLNTELGDLAARQRLVDSFFPGQITPAPPESATPPTPTNLKASGAMKNIVLSWDFPDTYTRLAHFEVWRSPTDALGNAVLIAQPAWSVYTDPVGPNASFYYWVRAVSDAATSPFNAVAGTQGSTAIDVLAALDALEGEITASQLHADLGARIDLIDGPEVLAGSVNARLATETAARIAAINQEASDRTAAVAAEASARGTAISNEATLRQTGDDSLAQQISLVTAGVAGGFDYGKVWYFDAGTESWTSTGATQATPTPSWVDLTSTGTDPAFLSPTSLALAGGTYPVVKARIKRLAGSGWDGTCFYATSGHGISGSHAKTIAAPSPFDVGDFAIVEFSMDALTAGGTDWLTSTIDQIRLDFGATASDVISVDWVAIGRNAPGASVAGLLTEQQARIAGDAAEATARLTLAAQVDTNTAGITDEVTARADADSALTTQINSVSAVANAKVKTFLQTTMPSDVTDGNLWFDSDDGNKAYRANGTTYAVADDTRIAQNAAAITTEQTARADGDSALSSQITSLTSTVNSNTAAIATEITARADGDSALTSQINAVSATANAKNRTYWQAAQPAGTFVVGDVWFDTDDSNKPYRWNGTTWDLAADARVASNAAAILTEQTARADGDSALASQITALSATVDDNTAAILSESTTRADEDTALSNQINIVAATADAKNRTYWQAAAPTGTFVVGDLWFDLDDNNKVYRWDGDSWEPTADARIAANAAAIVTEQTARADADDALSSEITSVSAVASSKAKVFVQSTAPTTGRSVNDLWYDTANGNRAYRFNGSQWMDVADTRIATNAAAIVTEQTARADGDSALSAEITTLTATVDGNTVAIQNEATARADADGYLGAQWTLRIDVNNLIGGFGFSGTSAGGQGAQFDFGVRSNRFFIAPPQGISNTKSAVFVYQSTATTVNGVSRPAGLYLSDLFVGNGVIDNAKMGILAVDTANIANVAVTNAKIASMSVGKLTTGSLAVAMAISSTNYSPNLAGFRISGNGSAEFNDVTVRGGVYATFGQIGGITIFSDALTSSNWNGSSGPGSAGWAIFANGNAWFNNLHVRGELNAGSMNGYAWPSAGSYGAHLSSFGLLVGNKNNNTYFQLDSLGNVYAPEFSIISGNATFSGALSAATGTFAGSLSAATGTFGGTLTAQVVNTSNIVGAAITTTSTATGNGLLGSEVILNVSTHTTDQSLVVLCDAGASKQTSGDGENQQTSQYVDYGHLSVDGVEVAVGRGAFLYVISNPTTTTVNLELWRTRYGASNVRNPRIVAMRCKR